MKNLIIILLFPCLLSGQAYYYKSFGAQTGSAAIQINFTRFSGFDPDWNSASNSPTVTGEHISDMFDENGQSTGVSLWVDTASNNSSHYSVPVPYASWPSAVTQRAWCAVSGGDFTISLRDMPDTNYLLQIYTNHQSFNVGSEIVEVNGVQHTYDNINMPTPVLLQVQASPDPSGIITIRIYSGEVASIAAMRITEM